MEKMSCLHSLLLTNTHDLFSYIVFSVSGSQSSSLPRMFEYFGPLLPPVGLSLSLSSSLSLSVSPSLSILVSSHCLCPCSSLSPPPSPSWMFWTEGPSCFCFSVLSSKIQAGLDQSIAGLCMTRHRPHMDAWRPTHNFTFMISSC